MADLIIRVEATELSHAILELASVLAMSVSAAAALQEQAHAAKTPGVPSAVSHEPPRLAPTARPEAETPSALVPTVVDLRAASKAKATSAEGKAAIKSLLDAFETKSVSDVPPERRAEFLAALEAL